MVSHPIQHFAPWHAQAATLATLNLKVFFYSDWGTKGLVDRDFGMPLKWDVPLLDGYEHEFLAAEHAEVVNDPDLDNPDVDARLNEFAPDVVQVFGYSHRTTHRAAGWAKRNKKPLLLYSDSNLKAQPLWKSVIKRPILGRFYAKVDGALYVGDNNLDYHRFFGLPPERLFPGCLPVDRARLLSTVPSPEETRSRIRSKYGIPADAFVLLFCGKFIERKRPLDVVRAAKQSGAAVWALMVGEGEQRAAMEAEITRAELRNVTLTGFVNQGEIPAYYAAADALTVTSSFDPHPLIVTEAAIFGLPVIISDKVGCIGPSDTARADINALVYRCGNVDELTAAVQRMRQDPGLYQRLSDASREIGATQDTVAAARQLEHAALRLREMGKR